MRLIQALQSISLAVANERFTDIMLSLIADKHVKQ